MADSRLSRQFPSGQLWMGILTEQGQKKRFKDAMNILCNNVGSQTAWNSWQRANEDPAIFIILKKKNAGAGKQAATNRSSS